MRSQIPFFSSLETRLMQPILEAWTPRELAGFRANQMGGAHWRSALILPWLSIQAEVDFDGDHHWNGGFAVFHGRLELVLADRFKGLFVQAHAQGADYAGILGVALRVDDDGDEADTLVLGAASLVGELGFNRVECDWSGDRAANVVQATTGVSPSARTVSIPVSRTEAATGAGAHAPARARPVRIEPYIGRVLHSDIRQHRIVGQNDVLLDIDGCVHGELGIVHGLNLGRDNRVLLDLG